MTTAGKRPQPASGTEDNAQLDPLEELARIMNDSNPNDPDRRSGQPEVGSGSAESTSGDALDLGLGADGLERYFQDPNFSPESQLSGSLGGSAFDDASLSDPLQPGSGQPADDVLAGLDFNNLDLPGLDEPVSAQAQGQEAEPLLSQHLTPRAPQQQAPATSAVSPQPVPPPLATSSDAPIAEDDLLAAMDQLALDDDPTWAAASATPFPASSSTASARPATAETPAFNAEAEPSFTPFSSQPAQSDALVDDGSHTFGAIEHDQLDDQPSKKGGGSGRTIAMALGVLALIGLTGVVIYGLFVNNGTDAGSPQLIAAPAGDNKEEPEITTNEERVPGEAVFSALDEGGQGTDAAPRVVLPGPGSTQLDLGANTPPPSADIAPAAPGSTAARPVRTVTVRADGTVVESTSTPAASAAVPAEQPVAAPQPVPVQTVASQIGAVALDAPATPQTQNDARLPSGGTTAPATSPTVTATQTATATPAAPPQPTARPSTTPQPVVAQPSTTGAPSTQPIQLSAPTNAPTTPAPAQPVQTQSTAPTTQVASAPALPSSVAPGDFIVQLASLRSEEQARTTFSALQSRFGSILTGFSPNIQEVDLGDRGIYHRVRLGPMDRADADSLCQRYQAAGGDCFVQRQ